MRSLALKESTVSGSSVGWEVSREWTLPRQISEGSLRAVGYRNTGTHTYTHLFHLCHSSHSLFSLLLYHSLFTVVLLNLNCDIVLNNTF